MLEAVVAVFIYKNEIYSIKRQAHLKAFPGYYAFPGGKLDKEDDDFGYQHPLINYYPANQIGALFREINEELNFSIEDALNQDKVLEVSKLGTAITPEFETFRFNAHFFKIVLKEKPKFILEEGEIAWGDWMSIAELNEIYHSGKGLMVFPTVRTIESLAADINIQEVDNFNLEYDKEQQLPYIEFLKGVGYIPVPSQTLPPSDTTNSLVIGDPGSLRIITDPSPESDLVQDKLMKTIESQQIDAIFITHHHPDHHERAPQIARLLKLPILCSKITQQWLLDRFGEDYLDGIKIRNIQQNEKITQWLGKDVICHELPGHDNGMLGLASDDMSWFYVSDLIVPFTSVVIPEPEGDMQVYFDSVNRVIKHNPKVLIPSHGVPMGGIHFMQTTLQHRIKREQEVIEMLNNGVEEDQIASFLYKNLDQRLIPFAEQNVRQHIKKIKADGLF